MKRALYLGCATPIKALKYEVSARNVAQRLGIELVDVPEFGCCGFPVRSVDPSASELMAARNLAVAEERGLDIVGLCTGCVAVLSETNELLQDARERGRVNAGLRRLGLKGYGGEVKVKHLARVLVEDLGLDALRNRVEVPLRALKLAVHYGCHYARPGHAHGFDDPTRPTSLDDLVRATGAATVDYPSKTLCCGLTVMGQAEDLGTRLAAEKLDSVAASGADALVVACPSCCVAYENNQKTIGRRTGRDYNIPVLYFTQVLGCAFALTDQELGFSFNRIPFEPISRGPVG